MEATGQHCLWVARDPSQPHRRHVYLIQDERHDELHAPGLTVHAGDMGVVRASGEVRPGDPICVEWPAEPHGGSSGYV